MTEALAVVFVLGLLAVTVVLLQRHGMPRLAPHGSREIAVILIRLAGDDSVNAIETRDAAIRIAFEFAAKMRHDLP